MFCPKCGSKRPDNARFCPGCGAPLTPAGAAGGRQKPVRKRSPLPKGIIAAAAAVCLVVIVGAVYFWGGGLLDGLSRPSSGQTGRDDDSSSGGHSANRPLFVVHPEFVLANGFINEIDQYDDAPDGFIPISTAEEFDKIRLNLGGSYILLEDIDLSFVDWEPVKGNFTGILDGNGHLVSNAGDTLFCEVVGGTIRNLGVYDDLIQEECVYGRSSIVYRGENIVLSNCYFDGSITAKEGNVGGLIYSLSGGTVIDCYNKASLSAGKGVGGIVYYALANSFFISNCFNEGTITGGTDCENSGWTQTDYCGGIIASTWEAGGSIWYCRNSGAVTCQAFPQLTRYAYHGSAVACGIAGGVYLGNNEQMEIAFCYNSGLISGGDIAFGICMERGSESRTVVSNCYNCGDFTLESNSYGIAGTSSNGNQPFDITIESCYNVSQTCMAGISNGSKALNNCYFLECGIDATRDGALFSTDSVKILSQSEMETRSSYSLDFDSVWQMGNRQYPYPVFKIGT